MIVEITDHGVPFDVTAQPSANAKTVAVEDRQLGGVGMFILKKLADTVEYRQVNKRNVVRVMLTVGAREGS